METSHTTSQADRYNLLWEIESILSPTTDTTGNGSETTVFFNGNQRKQLKRQIQQGNVDRPSPPRLLLQQKRQIQLYGNPRYTAVV